MSTESSVRRYGNLRRPTRPGLLGFGAAASLIGFFGLILCVFAMMAKGPLGGAVMFVLVLLALLPSRRSARDGRSGYERGFARFLNRRNRRSGRAALLQGPAGFTPDGRCRLPGLLAASELFTVKDAYGGEFGLLHVPSTGHYTVVIECAGTGQDLVDEDEHDRQVAHWGQFLSLLGEYSEVAGASVVIETAPDTGVRLRDAVQGRRANDAPPFASTVMDELIDSYPRGEAQIRTWVTITFTSVSVEQVGSKSTTRRATRQEMESRIGNLLPTIVGALRVTGAGTGARVMAAADVTDAVRVCFDPSVAMDVEQARREGGTGLAWEDAGPVRLRPEDTRLHHDRAWSSSWQMLEPPTGAFFSDQLTRLLSPHPDVMRKRVAMLFRPHDHVTAAQAVEADVNAAAFTASQRRRPSSRQVEDVRAAQQTATEEATGAGLVRFGMIITLTVDEPDKLPKAEAALMQMRASARLRLRPALGNQEVAFTASLPCGLVLPKHARMPDEFRDLM